MLKEKSQIVAYVSLYIENAIMIAVKNWIVELSRVKQCALQMSYLYVLYGMTKPHLDLKLLVVIVNTLLSSAEFSRS